MDAYQRAENYGTTGRYQVREEFANYACALAEANHIPIEQRARVAKKAADFLEKSILEDPSGAIHYMYMATLVNSTFAVLKQTDPGLAVSLAEKSLAWLQKAESLGPNRPQLYMERAQLLRSLGRNDDVIPVLQKVVAFDPPAKWSRVHLVAAYISAGRYRDAEIEWNKIKTYNRIPSQSDYDRVIGLYASKKQFAPVVVLYKEQLQTSPDNPVLLLNLANAYKELGDLDSARQTVRRAATLSPQIAEKLPDLLKSLEAKVATLK
jgi:tetratricopeptide (TPR) repeat protein